MHLAQHRQTASYANTFKTSCHSFELRFQTLRIRVIFFVNEAVNTCNLFLLQVKAYYDFETALDSDEDLNLGSEEGDGSEASLFSDGSDVDS